MQRRDHTQGLFSSASHLVLPRSWHHLSRDVPGCRYIQATPYGGPRPGLSYLPHAQPTQIKNI